MSLFASNIRGALLQFRAGKMTKVGTTVTGDPRQGIFALVQQPSGSLEVDWMPEGKPELKEVRIIAGPVSVSRAAKCKTGRVFVIDFGSDQQLFFWLQERSEERDEEYLKVLKRHIERQPGAAGPGGSAVAGAATGTAAAASTGAAGSTGPASGIQLSALQNILSTLGQSGPASPPPSSSTAAGASTSTPVRPAPQAAADRATLDLQRLLLSPQLLEAVRRDPAFYMSRLHEHLPPNTDPSDDIARHIRNPQVTAAASMLQAALSEPEGFREVSAAFGINTAAASGRDIGALPFVQAIAAEPKTTGGDSEATEKK